MTCPHNNQTRPPGLINCCVDCGAVVRAPEEPDREIVNWDLDGAQLVRDGKPVAKIIDMTVADEILAAVRHVCGG